MANPFEDEISASAAALNLTYQKLAIPLSLRRAPAGLPYLMPLAENPYDSYLAYRGRHIALELKYIDDEGTFPLKNVETHQVEGLQRALADGCPAWLLIQMRHRIEERVVRKRPVRVVEQKRLFRPQAWALDFRHWNAFLASLKFKNGNQRTTVPREVFDQREWFLPIPRIPLERDGKKVQCWDLRVLLPEDPTPDRLRRQIAEAHQLLNPEEFRDWLFREFDPTLDVPIACLTS